MTRLSLILCADKVSQNSWAASARHEERALISLGNLRDRFAFYTRLPQKWSLALRGGLQVPRPTASLTWLAVTFDAPCGTVCHILNLTSRGLFELQWQRVPQAIVLYDNSDHSAKEQ